jgi:hypothetical protein
VVSINSPPLNRDWRKVGGSSAKRASERVVWILRLVKIGAEAEGQAVDVMEMGLPQSWGCKRQEGIFVSFFGREWDAWSGF